MPIAHNPSAVVQAIDEWLASLPPGACRKRALAIPPDDEYGFATLLALEPARPDACPIELGVTVPGAGSTVGIFLDTWASVARRLALDLSADKGARVALFVEPRAMTTEQILDACAAIAAGLVHLDAGIFRRKLISTSGWLDTRAGRFNMRGVEDYLVPFLRPLTPLEIVKIQTLGYQPWM